MNMNHHYAAAWFSGDETHCAITVVEDGATLNMAAYREGTAEDVLDVALYGDPRGSEEERGWYLQSETSLQALVRFANEGLRLPAVLDRLRADLSFHQAEYDKLAESLSDLEEPYEVENDLASAYHLGRVEALQNVLDILLGREVKLYSETGDEEVLA